MYHYHKIPLFYNIYIYLISDSKGDKKLFLRYYRIYYRYRDILHLTDDQHKFHNRDYYFIKYISMLNNNFILIL
jgi:hypothetical protein